MVQFDHEVDVVVVGSGAGGLTAAIAAGQAGLRPMVLESTELIGGSSAMSGGGMWIPANPLLAQAGVEDSFDNGLTYMNEVIGDVGPASSPERKEAFLREGPRMVEWLESLGFEFHYAPGYADYYPERPGGLPEGRCIESALFDLGKLGTWRKKVRIAVPLPMYTVEASQLALALRTVEGFTTAAKIVGLRAVGGRVIGKRLTGSGGALIGRLLLMCLQQGIPLRLNSPLKELVVDDGRVRGVVVEHKGRELRIGAARGVILAAGGFEHNAEMRRQYQTHPIGADWTVANPGNTGGAIAAGIDIGAATALMDDAWWGPCYVDGQGTPGFLLWERSMPHGLIVGADGRRFMNESASYVDCGHAMYERNATVQAIPSWLVFDSRHRRSYPLGMMLPGMTPKSAIESGFVTRASTLAELAAACGIDSVGLAQTVARFNGFAETGVDEDFHRGDSAYDRVYSDPRVGPNPNLGTVDEAPFYAIKVWPGDLGTKGGLLADEHSRVLREDGSVIEGLYATGNCSASVMGHTYPGAGSTLAPTMIFGMIAARHIAG